ncbi:MAG: hypothetical protein ACKODX_21055, partial [Gemmata sp.]
MTSRTRRNLLSVEVLEDRSVPAAITVTTLNDTVAVDGLVSLREAVQSINGGANINGDVVAVGAYGTSDTINFTGLSGTITLTSNLDTITRSVTIDGTTGTGFAGTPVITVSGDAKKFRTFVITGPNVVISSLAILRSSADGILITGSGATNASIIGNHIGLDSTSNTGASIVSSGVCIKRGATGANIGGTSPGARNVISGSGLGGVYIADPGTSNNVVAGNYIGTDATGTRQIINRIGVIITGGASNNRIGGTSAAERNVISGSNSCVQVNQTATGNTVQGNFIGTDVSGTVGLDNEAAGVLISSGANNNVIGGLVAGAGNLIAFNRIGVEISAGFFGTLPQNNSVLGNSIVSNRRLGIDLGPAGVTANDNLDADTGPNGLQNYPVISSVVGNQAFGSLHSTPNSSFRVEFFSNTARDASGFGQGQTYLGFLNVTTDASGDAPFTFTAPS